jgi:uncharacterized protein YecT (DUF1311 family)
MGKRNSFVAAGLGLLSPGLGHLYLARPGRFLARAAMAAFTVISLGLIGVLSTLYGAITYVALIAFLILFSVIDSFVIARKNEVALNWYNRWYVYVLWIASITVLFIFQAAIRETVLGFNIYRVVGSAFSPLIENNDWLLVDTRAYRDRGPTIGEVVLTRRQASASAYEKLQERFYRSVFIAHVTGRPSENTFSYVVSAKEMEQQYVPINALVGKPTTVFFSKSLNRIGLDFKEQSGPAHTPPIERVNSGAIVDCRSSDDAALASCLALEVWTADQRINQIYQELMEHYPDSKRKNLRDEQRSWLRMRDSACHLDSRESNREKWILAISSDYQKTVCMVRFTQQRIITLEAYRKIGVANTNTERQATLPVGKEVSLASDLSELQQDYSSHSNIARSNGKWYFEIKVNMTELAKYGNASLYLGLEDNMGNGYGKLLYAYNNPGQRTVINYGFAIDLENGKLYRHVDGAWLVATPGSAKGMDLKLNRRYYVKATSSVPVFNPLRSLATVVSINTGEKAFEYSLPAEYRPFNGQ